MRQPRFTAEAALGAGGRYRSPASHHAGARAGVTPQQAPDPACQSGCDFSYQSCLIGCQGDEACQYGCWTDLSSCISGCASGGGGWGGWGSYY